MVAANGRQLCILAWNRVNVVAVTTILVLHVGVIGHHVPCHYDFMFPRRSYHVRLRARGVWGALPPGRGVWGGLHPPQGRSGVWGAARPPTCNYFPLFSTIVLLFSTIFHYLQLFSSIFNY